MGHSMAALVGATIGYYPPIDFPLGGRRRGMMPINALDGLALKIDDCICIAYPHFGVRAYGTDPVSCVSPSEADWRGATPVFFCLFVRSFVCASDPFLFAAFKYSHVGKWFSRFSRRRGLFP